MINVTQTPYSANAQMPYSSNDTAEFRSQTMHQDSNGIGLHGCSFPLSKRGSLSLFQARKSFTSMEEKRVAYSPSSPKNILQSHGDNLNWAWTVESNAVPTIPHYYPIERNSLETSNLSVECITNRISDFLRIHSITSSYRSETGRVDCMSPSLLKFVIQLWRVTNKSLKKKSFMVEVQRRQGCGIEMHNIRSALYKSILTGEQAKSSSQIGNQGLKCPSETLRMDIVDARNSSTEAMGISLRLLENGKLDQNRLGLESLCALTNPTVVSHNDAFLVSKAIIVGEEPLGTRLRRCLLVHLQNNNASVLPYQIRNSNDQEDSCNFDLKDAGNFAIGTDAALHQIALEILANALQVLLLKSQKENQENTIGICSDSWSPVIKTLKFNIRDFNLRPHASALSAKCIRLLADARQDLAIRILASDVQLVCSLQQAHNFGVARHSNLARESKSLLDQMG